MTRWSATLFAVLGVAAIVRFDATPVVQLDVWTDGPVDIHRIAPAPVALAETLGTMPEFHPLPRPGHAHAAVSRAEQVMTAVSVTQLAPNRVRIRLATEDTAAGARVLDAVGEDYAAAGVAERLRLATRTSGGLLVGIAQAVGALAAVALACEGMAALARRRRRARRDVLA